MFIMKEMNSSINIAEPQRRIFEIDGKEKLNISTNTSRSGIGKITKNHLTIKWIADRIYDEQLNVLNKDKSFIQYFGNEK